MYRIDELIDALKEAAGVSKAKKCNVIAIVIIVLLCIVAIAAAVFAVYKFLNPSFDEDEDFDFDDEDDFDEFFEDEEEEESELTVSPVAKEEAIDEAIDAKEVDESKETEE